MISKKLPLILIIFILLQVCFAQESIKILFYGVINSNNINLRSDSNTSSQIICKINKNTPLEIIQEKYDWYKIKLPKIVPLYVRKDLITLIDKETAKASKDNINIRLEPNESCPILGQIRKNEIITILGDSNGWYKIEPVDNSFGWIHKKFVDRIAKDNAPMTAPIVPAKDICKEGSIILEGTIQPYGKVINRIATHKLVTKNFKIFLLKGNPSNLNTLIYHNVQITGEEIIPKKEKYPVIEIIRMEVID
ncbi:MAG: SH3 domain-containing protein [Candidatus Omnitrophota bacterium]